MKKMIICLIIFSIIIFQYKICAKEFIERDLYINGEKIQSEIPAFNISGNESMVSVRIIADELGAKIIWDKEKRVAVIGTESKYEIISVDNNYMFPKKIYNNRLFVRYDAIKNIFDKLGYNIHVKSFDYDVYIANDDSYEKAKEHGKIVIGMPEDDFSYLSEFKSKLSEAIANEMNLDIEIIKFSDGEEINALKAKEIDAVWSNIVYEKEKQESLLFFYPYIDTKKDNMYVCTFPYATDGIVLLAKNSSKITVQSDIEKSILGCVESDYKDIVNSLEFINRQELKVYQSEEKMLNALDNGELDAIIGKKLDLQYKFKNSEEYKILPFLYNKQDYSIAFRKEDVYLRNAINDALIKISDNDIFKEIYDSIFGTYEIGYIYFNNDTVIYNGYTYIRQAYDTSIGIDGWRILNTRKLTDISDFIGDFVITFSNDSSAVLEFFEAVDSYGTVLGYMPTIYYWEDKWKEIYIRSDYNVPEINAENISKIGIFPCNSFLPQYFNYHCEQTGKYIDDKDIIKELTDIIRFGEEVPDDINYKLLNYSIFLYSDKLPGCGYYVNIGKINDEYIFITHDKKVKIDSEKTSAVSGGRLV